MDLVPTKLVLDFNPTYHQGCVARSQRAAFNHRVTVGRTALLDQIATLFGVMKELAPWSAVLLLLQLKPGTRKFASLRDADIEVLMARIEAKEAAKASGTEVDLTEVEKVKCRRRVVKHEVVQACFKCCGLELHEDESALACTTRLSKEWKEAAG